MNRYFSFFIPLLLACFLAVHVQAAPNGDAAGKRIRSAKAKSSRQSATAAKKKSAKNSQKSQHATKVVKTKKRASATGTAKSVRTRRKSIVSPVVARQEQWSSSDACSAEVGSKITSKSVMILDAHTGDPIFAKAADNPRQPASTIKVLTGLIALKRLQQHEAVEVSPHAESMPRSKIYLSSKQQYKADDLINAVLLESANDASVALAEKIAGSESAFAKLMTLHARLWGAENTICRTASGLTAVGQQSTARDLAQIFRHAMQDKDFADRMSRTSVTTACGKTLRNHNKALWQVEGAMGGKTGYTSIARQTYVGQFRRGNDAIVVAIMGSETMWRDIKRLVDYGFRKKEQLKLAQFSKDSPAKVQ